MTDREKIIKIAQPYVSAWGDDERLADALIAANIGDVMEWKHRSEVAERQVMVLSKWLAEKTRKDYPWRAWLDAAQKQAEKEIAEEKND